MAITRGNVASYLHSQFSNMAAAVGQADSGDTASGSGADVDNALRKLGTAEGDLATAEVEDGLRDVVFALGEFYAARRFWRMLGDRVSHTMGETTYRFESQRDQAKAMMDEAAKLCGSLGYDVNGGAKRPLFKVY